jgi:hypothetical protein
MAPLRSALLRLAPGRQIPGLSEILRVLHLEGLLWVGGTNG